MLPALKTPRFSWPAMSAVSLLQNEVDDLFNRFFGDSSGPRQGAVASGWQIPLSISDDGQNIFVEAELPGMSQEDLEVVVRNGNLIIRGERKLSDEQRNYWYSQRMFGRFERSISLAEMVDPDDIDATLSDGVLSIKLTKRPEARPKRIAIKAE